MRFEKRTCKQMCRHRLVLRGALIGLLISPAAMAEPPRKSIPFTDTAGFERVDGSGWHRQSFQRLLHARNAEVRARTPAAEGLDVGDVAVIVANDAIVVPPDPGNPFDLPVPSALSFVPAPEGHEFTVSFTSLSLDPSFGPEVVFTEFGDGSEPGDDASGEVTLPFSFPFLGASYGSVWVNSDGNITLGVGDPAAMPRDAARLIGGPPRIAPLFTDLDPANSGTVHADARADKVVITWNGVTNFVLPGFPTTSNTFQVVLHAGGAIDFVYETVFDPLATIFSSGGVIGVAAGMDEAPYNEIDLIGDLPGSFEAGAIFEEFRSGVPGYLDDFALAREFYRSHDDRYDFLVAFSDFAVDLNGAFAYNHGIQNHTRGLGQTNVDFDFTPLIGPGVDELESIVFMNRIGLYWPDAGKMADPPLMRFHLFRPYPGPPGTNAVFRQARVFGTALDEFGISGRFTLGLNSAMSVMAQEVGHRWLAYAGFVHPVTGCAPPFGPPFFCFDSLDLLGRGLAHWSFFFNTRVPEEQFPGGPSRASSMEGNALRDLGAGALADKLPFPCTRPGETTFLSDSNELIDGYSELDQYFMGLRTAGEVAPFWYADAPRSALVDEPLEGSAVDGPVDDAIFCGQRVDLTIADILAAPFVEFDPTTFQQPFNGGPRVPALGDEVDSPCGEDRKTMAFILLVRGGPPSSAAHAAAIQQVETFRRTWEWYGNGPATGGRGKFDTSLDPSCH